MSLTMRFPEKHLSDFGRNWLRFLLWGFGLLILGIAALYTTAVATIISVVMLGFLIFLSGVILLFDALSFWRDKWASFILHFIAAILYIAVGGTLIIDPVAASISITLLLGIFYILIGSYRLVFAVSSRLPNWGWMLFNGMVTLSLGFLILISWPESSLFILGIFIGIDLIFAGFSYMMYALAARGITKRLG